MGGDLVSSLKDKANESIEFTWKKSRISFLQGLAFLSGGG